MLKIQDYSEQIDALHERGFSALDIAKKLRLKYPQPIYNYLRKRGGKDYIEILTGSRHYMM